MEELRGVLEQLVADGSCFRTAPASSTMGRVMRHLTQGASGYEANLAELRAAAQNALLFVFPLEKDLEMCLRFERVQGTGLALTRLGVSPVNGDLWTQHWAMRALECTGGVFAVESAPGACNLSCAARRSTRCFRWLSCQPWGWRLSRRTSLCFSTRGCVHEVQA